MLVEFAIVAPAFLALIFDGSVSDALNTLFAMTVQAAKLIQ